MGFRERWVCFIHKAATGTKKTRTLLTPFGVTIFGLFTALFVLAAIFVDRLLDLPRLLPEGARLPISIPVITVGIAVTAWSVFHFLKVKGTLVPFNPPSKVVKTNCGAVCPGPTGPSCVRISPRATMVNNNNNPAQARMRPHFGPL